MQDYKKFMTDLAYQAGKIMKDNFITGMKKEWKQDNTPLTVTDTAVNKLVIEAVRKNYPHHSILGEEESSLRKSEYVWVCDPLDGTLPFSHGQPTFVFALALTKNGKSINGVIYDPVLDRLVYAESGKGATLNDKKITVSRHAGLQKAVINTDTKLGLINIKRELLAQRAKSPTLYSADYCAMLVACGEFAAEICDSPNAWDAAAVKIIVEEAGGKVTSLSGENQRYDQKVNGFIASNGIIHDQLVSLIRKEIKTAG